MGRYRSVMYVVRAGLHVHIDLLVLGEDRMGADDRGGSEHLAAADRGGAGTLREAVEDDEGRLRVVEGAGHRQ